MKGVPSPVFISGGNGLQAACCPVCQTPSDAWTRLADGPGGGPKPGSVAVCVYCSSVLVYALGARGLSLRKPTDAEMAAMADDGLLEVTRQYTLEIRRGRQQ